MWYFAWILGLGLAVTVAILNGIWHEFTPTQIAPLIPAAINHDTCAQARLETEVTRAGSATKSFQAWQQASTMAR